MRKIIYACVMMLSLGLLVSCGDDGPEGGKSNVSSGNVKIGSDSFKVKYAYVGYDEDHIDYVFYDKDILKYLEDGEDLEELDIEFSGVQFCYDPVRSKVLDLLLMYKANPRRATGVFVEAEGIDFNQYIKFTVNSKNVKASASSIPMTSINMSTGREKDVEVSFSLDATPLDVSDLEDEYDDVYEDDYAYKANTSNDIIVREVTPAQIATLKSILNKGSK